MNSKELLKKNNINMHSKEYSQSNIHHNQSSKILLTRFLIIKKIVYIAKKKKKNYLISFDLLYKKWNRGSQKVSTL
jgi:hypothetical protein